MSHKDINLDEIVKESQLRIKRSLVQGFEYDHLVIVKSSQFLREHYPQRMNFSVMYVDLVDSTRMSTELSPDVLSRIITIFSQEIAFAVEHFGGYVLKFMGDAVLAYFPRQDLGARSDGEYGNQVIHCGIVIAQIVKKAINPLLLQQGYRGIEIKITADYGQHTIVRYGSDRQKSHIDIISATMNLASKMQALVRANQMVIGDNLYQHLSQNAKGMFAEINLDRSKWDYHYHHFDPEPYRTYVTKF